MRSTVPIRQGRMRPSVQRRRVQGRRKLTLGGKLLLLLPIPPLFIPPPPPCRPCFLPGTGAASIF